MANSANIPIIDLAGDQAEVARQLVNAAEEHGFIYIKNLGNDIPPKDIDGAFELVRHLTMNLVAFRH
jgi:isopenicillin N synthase-like dioxygenase